MLFVIWKPYEKEALLNAGLFDAEYTSQEAWDSFRDMVNRTWDEGSEPSKITKEMLVKAGTWDESLGFDEGHINFFSQVNAALKAAHDEKRAKIDEFVSTFDEAFPLPEIADEKRKLWYCTERQNHLAALLALRFPEYYDRRKVEAILEDVNRIPFL